MGDGMQGAYQHSLGASRSGQAGRWELIRAAAGNFSRRAFDNDRVCEDAFGARVHVRARLMDCTPLNRTRLVLIQFGSAAARRNDERSHDPCRQRPFC